ncbi:unnamed protein product [marine sediment metagenome]|uniref:Peptidase M41 domain-containing protein n=1 Tax=marine sediment metagenome TaxID=412755 RepID=X0ZU55_9ZZZZ
MVDDAYDKAKDILSTHRSKLDLIAQNLIEKETLNKEQVEELLKDKKEEVEEVATEFKKDTKKDAVKRETVKEKKPLIVPKPVLESK